MAFTPIYGTGFEMGTWPGASVDMVTGSMNVTTGPHTGTYCAASDSNGVVRWRAIPGSGAEMYGAMWIDPSHNLAIWTRTGGCIFGVELGDGNLVGLYWDGSTKTWNAYANGVVQVGSWVVPSNTWHHVQFHVTIHDTTGVIESKIDGITNTTFSGDTKPGASGTIAYCIWQIPLTNSNAKLDDIVYGTGGWPGDLRADYILPNADTATEEWDRSAGVDSYALIDERPKNDADYIYTAVDAEQTIVEMTDWDDTDKIPEFVVAWARAKKDDASGSQIKIIDSDGVATNVSSGHDLATGYLYLDEILLTAPDGGAWTDADVDALELGVESDIIP